MEQDQLYNSLLGEVLTIVDAVYGPDISSGSYTYSGGRLSAGGTGLSYVEIPQKSKHQAVKDLIRASFKRNFSPMNLRSCNCAAAHTGPCESPRIG